ncbi:MAG: M6 family metalloprotease domain-containing protein, partial [Muribaculaceae bacterium]|nr:M6 family metalloprotease domain-containing protein [Muribaculaceae bacterium]
VLLCAAVSGVALSASAVPARPGLHSFMQPDGTEIRACIVGDENSHYYLAEDGRVLVMQGDALVEASAADKELMKRAPVKRAPIGRYPDSHFPCTGEQRAIVILVEYQDVKFRTENPADYFSRMLNEEGFSDLGGTGSARDFFIENSGGLFRPTFDVYGPVTLREAMGYYGVNDIYGVDVRPHEMAIEACELLDSTVDFTEYDRDGDGIIDNVFIYYAGRGEATGGASNTVWPHSWQMSVAEPDKDFIYDGVRLEGYGCTNEWDVYNGVERPDAIGVFVHEFSHILGLPDLYNTVDQYGTFTPGSWSTLDSGPYNNNSCTPPLYGAFERNALGWLEPRVIDRPATVSLKAVGTNEAILIPTSSPEEFFLLENRQQTGWDTYLPGHGMLVWHIDYRETAWADNTVNNRPSHQYVDLEEADGVLTANTRDGDSFPGTAGVTEFSDSTTPSMLTWTGESLDLPITDIEEHPDGTVTFLVGGGFVLPGATRLLDPVAVEHDSFTAVWTVADDALGYTINVGEMNEDGIVAEWISIDAGDVLSLAVDGLTPATEYGYRVTAYNRCGEGPASPWQRVVTEEYTFERMTPVALEATEVGSGWFTANWERLEAAESYRVDVYTKRISRTGTQTCDFTAGTKKNELPEGWTSTSEASFAMSTYAGEAIPSLRLNNDGDCIMSAVYPGGVTAVSLWTRGNATDSSAQALVEGKLRDEWIEIGRVDVDKNAGGATVTFDAIPEEVTSIRICYLKGETGSLAIDDITVTYCVEKERDGLKSHMVEAGRTALKVDGLQPVTTYYYDVTGLNGGQESRSSGEVRVRTTEPSATEAIMADSIRIVREGGYLIVECAPGTKVKLTDLTGRRLAGVISGSDGKAVIGTAEKGCLILTIAGESHKIII